jgi:hypothetical protein
MKIANIHLILGFALVVACNEPESPSTPEAIDPTKASLQTAIKGSHYTPEGEIKSKSFFYGPETFQHRTDYYYDAEGKILVKVQIGHENDTTGIFLNEYLENGDLGHTAVYSRDSSGFQLAHLLKRTYEDQGKTVEVLLEKNGVSTQYERFGFDASARATYYRRGTDSAYSMHEYVYANDSSYQISEELYLERGMTEPFYRYRYDYDSSGLLTAKSLEVVSPGFRPAVEYRYDQEGRLIEEIENDLYFGTTRISRSTYEYY